MRIEHGFLFAGEIMIAVQGISIVQGSFSLQPISFTIPSGKYGVLMGKTGSGKSTVLEMIAGLRRNRTGTIHLAQRDVTHLPPRERAVGYVPQDGALFRTMTVRTQIGFPLLLRRASAAQIEKRVTELAQQLNISHLLDRYPIGLSGGEAQRVALGRALSFQPQILLLDEPLSSLDEETREQLIELLSWIQSQTQMTVLHVTHHRQEAERLGQVRLRLVNGQIQAEP